MRCSWLLRGHSSQHRLSIPAGCRACADDLVDEHVRARMLKHSDGQVAHLETEYNDLLIDKHGSLLGLSSTYERHDYIESIVDLKDRDAMTLMHGRIMPAALAYPQETRRILIIGLGAASISTYLGAPCPTPKSMWSNSTKTSLVPSRLPTSHFAHRAFEQTPQVNLLGAAKVMHACFPNIIERHRGTIVYVSSRMQPVVPGRSLARCVPRCATSALSRCFMEQFQCRLQRNEPCAR
jgi:NAD(P)-dependent dehydrogenase (short-subunit alcohol dehydrogenase family)